MQEDIVDAINILSQSVEQGYCPTTEEQAFILDAEEVLAISLNQISFIKETIHTREVEA